MESNEIKCNKLAKVNILHRASLRGLKRCQSCGTISGLRAVMCRNDNCDLRKKMLAAVKPYDPIQLITRNSLRLFSLKTRDKLTNVRNFVRLKTEYPAVPSTTSSGKTECYVDSCKYDPSSMAATGCRHIKACRVASDIPKAEVYPLDMSVLWNLNLGETQKQHLWDLYECDRENVQPIQRLDAYTFVVVCDKTKNFTAGLLHVTVVANSVATNKRGFYSCACKKLKIVVDADNSVIMKKEICDHILLVIAAILHKPDGKTMYADFLESVQYLWMPKCLNLPVELPTGVMDIDDAPLSRCDNMTAKIDNIVGAAAKTPDDIFKFSEEIFTESVSTSYIHIDASEPYSIGSDTGGSTRNPASYCGVVGLKPTYGLVSRHGLIPLVNSMDVPGIFTRSVSDCVDILNAVAGPDAKDSTMFQHSYRPITLARPDEIDLRTIRIGIPKEYYCQHLSAEVLETWRKIADILEDGGAQVRQVSLPHTASSIYVYSILNQCEVASNMARYDGIEYGHRADDDRSTEELYAKTRAEGFSNVVKNRILSGNYFLLRKNYNMYFEKALRVRRLISEDFRNVFSKSPKEEQVDLLLTPTTLSDAPLYKDFVSVSNRDQCAVQDYCTQPANMAGIPAISIPIRLSSQGLPIGLQLMSDTLKEDLLLTVAHWIEAQVGFDSLVKEQLFKMK